MSTQVIRQAPTDSPERKRRLGLVLAVCCLSQLMVILDGSIVNVALPAIQRAMHFSVSTLQWVPNAYIITFAAFLLLSGRIADLFGRRKVLLIGIVVFTAFSLVGGLSQDGIMLVLARAGQGIGASIIAAAALAVLSSTFTEPAARAKAFALWGAAAGSGGAIGVLSGGAIVEWLSWRWILLVNVPIGALMFAMAMASVTERRDPHGRSKLDVPGALSVALGVAALVYGLAEGQQKGWGSPQIVGALCAAAVLLAFFALDQLKLARQPLVVLSIFGNRSVSAANALMFLVGATLPATFYFLTLLYQEVLGYSPMRTGLAFLPLTGAAFVGAGICSGLVPKVGPRPVLFMGLLPAIGGMFWMAQVNQSSTYTADLLGPSLLFGFGLGAIVTAAAGAATAGVPDDQQGLASGLLNMGQQIGGAAGLAAMVALATSRTSSVMGQSRSHAMMGHALTAGYAAGFFAAGCLLVVALAAAVAIPRISDGEAGTAPAAERGSGTTPAEREWRAAHSADAGRR